MFCYECPFAGFIEPVPDLRTSLEINCIRFNRPGRKYDECPAGENFWLAGLDEIARMREVWRKEKQIVVLTNGCFDLLHVGHIRSLEGARKLGDVLVVGLNSDESVRRLKGAGRPVFGERERAEMLSAIRWVDYVVIFDGERATELIERLKPDIHAKGTDYTEESVPERELVLSYGGKIAIVGDPKNHSSSEILARLKQ